MLLHYQKTLLHTPFCLFLKSSKAFSVSLILANSVCSFQNSCVTETGLSGFHKVIVTVMKATFGKLKSKIIYYRDYKNFSNNHFRNFVINKLPMKTIKTDSKGLEKFLQISLNAKDKFETKKKKIFKRKQHAFHKLAFKKSSYENKST